MALTRDVESIYNILNKQIRNFIPGKTVQRRCIEFLRHRFFPVALQEQYTTTQELAAEGALVLQTLRPAVHVPAATLQSVQPCIPEELRLAACDVAPLQVFTLEKGYCFRSFILDKDRRFVRDGSYHSLWRKNLYRNNAEIRAKQVTYIDEEAIALTTSFTDNYYHWFADLVARLLMLPDYRDKVICTDLRYPYQKETLGILGIPSSRIVSMSDYSLYQFAKVTGVSVNPGFCPQPLMQLQEFAKDFIVDTAAPRRLYISRGDTPNRRNVANEKELLPILNTFDFSVQTFSGVPVAKQISMLRHADYVVFPQGAAVVNMAFCKPATRFLELYSPHYLDQTGASISAGLQLVHHILVGECSETAQSKQSNFSIDPALFEKALAALTAQ